MERNFSSTNWGKRLDVLGYSLHGNTRDMIGRNWKYRAASYACGPVAFFNSLDDLVRWVRQVEEVRLMVDFPERHRLGVDVGAFPIGSYSDLIEQKEKEAQVSINPSQFDRLSVWVKEHIADLQRQRDVAVRSLREFEDSKTVSRVWVEDNPCLGETTGPSTVKHYLQTRDVCFRVGGSVVRLYLREDDELEISAGSERLYFRPQASNLLQIVEVKKA